MLSSFQSQLLSLFVNMAVDACWVPITIFSFIIVIEIVLLNGDDLQMTNNFLTH